MLGGKAAEQNKEIHLEPEPKPKVGLTRFCLLLVALFIEADPSAVKKGVQGLLLALAWQAAQALGASLSVHPTRLPFSQGACHAASTARLLHQLTSHRAGRADGDSFLIARFTVHEGHQAL